MASGSASPSAPAQAAPAADVSSASSSPKLPPPETQSDVRRRSHIVWSFWLVIVLLGLPIWWKTTTIYRANLPLEGMLEWAEGKACRPVFPLQISIQADSLQENEAQNLVRLTQHALDDHNDFSGHHLRLQLAPKRDSSSDAVLDDNVALTIQLTPGETNAASLNPHSAVLDIVYPPNAIPGPSSSSSALATYIAKELQSTFSEEQSTISYLLSTSSAPDARPQNLSPEAAEILSKRTTRSLRYAPTYHLTFSLFTAGAIPNSWDIETAIDEYMKPMLHMLGPIHNFTIDTQVQLYATPGTQSQVLSKADLASFINAAEWPLSPSIGGAPTVNFVIYIGDQNIGLTSESKTSESETSQSWMIPQWGTIYLLSLPDTTTHISSEKLRQAMLTFNGHLLSLLATALPSISIPRSVADGVASTMDHLQQACGSLGGPEGLYHARIAEEEAERAFFEKSMVGQLYFPDEHKIAVYLPLLGPVGVPLIMGLINELKNWIKRRRQRAKEAGEKKSQ
ncbi:hypothetical protein G7Z17_g3313 [Cylindrodendrum hubeiense]|uniref:GPI transamidase component PIG-S n=1 Tax=Cylindrodendrum hubeiense TaxID=595255 RepID=A0A9P5HG71_9HYPO|nr:hypothetical protein G7Z17_g3313 [Cylindrodendrum hubeiense]